MKYSKTYYVYIMMSISGVFYVGITSNLLKRIYQHKNALHDGFTSKYKCTKLVYFEETNEVEIALNREKQIKNWARNKKEKLIELTNKDYVDLSNQWR